MAESVFFYMMSNGHVYGVVRERMPARDRGETDFRAHVIRIDTTMQPTTELDTYVHEFLHAEKPKWKHKLITPMSEHIAAMLCILGFRRTGVLGMEPCGPGFSLMLEACDTCIRLHRPKWDDDRVTTLAGSMAAFLWTAGYRRGGGRAKRKRGRAGGGGGRKRADRLGFKPRERSDVPDVGRGVVTD